MSKIEITAPQPMRINNLVEAAFLALKRDGIAQRRRPDPTLLETDGVSWVCARVRSGREFAVADDLKAIGFRVFCPHGVKVYMRARVPGGEKRTKAERDFPVFGSYVFVGEPKGVFLGRHSHWHIFDVLENAGGSRYIPTQFVSAASEAWAHGKWDSRVTAAERLTGKNAKIVSGSMEGWNVVVERLPSELRAIVQVRMFGALRSVEVDTSALELL